jgi:hypothetical protein
LSSTHEQPEVDAGEDEVDHHEPTMEADVPGWLFWGSLVGIVMLAVGAGIGRLLDLDTLPAGLAEAELEHGLLARQSSDFGLQWAIENAGPLSLPLVVVISWIGAVTGYDVETQRIAAALFGAGSILCTGLWLYRAMGPLWGLAGAAVLAGSFWHILFSRLATGQIAGAFALAALFWTLTEAGRRQGTHAMPWYLLAGLAPGFGFLATPSLRLLPVVLLGILAVSLWRMRQEPEQTEARNWLIASAASYLVVSPYLISHRDALDLWTPWAETPGLPGNDPVTIPTLATALIDTVSALVLPGDAEWGLNLPSDAWFSLLILPWALIGVLGLISASNNPRLRNSFLTGLGIGGAALLGISARDAGHPGQLVVISPALAGLAIFGFRTVLRWAKVRTVRYALTALIVAGIAGQAVISVQQYADEWSAEPDTSAAFHANVTNALITANTLETDEPVFISLDGHEAALDYFRTTLRRHTFPGGNILQFPADEDGYLLIVDPVAAELEPLLEQAGSVTQLREASGVPAYRLDARIREEMPLSAPTVTYPRGPVLHGASEPSQTGAGTVRFLVAWKSDAESPSFTVEARLRTAEQTPRISSELLELPPNPLQTRLFQVLSFEIEIPEFGTPTDVELRLIREDGSISAVAGMDDEGYLVLNRYTFVE